MEITVDSIQDPIAEENIDTPKVRKSPLSKKLILPFFIILGFVVVTNIFTTLLFIKSSTNMTRESDTSEMNQIALEEKDELGDTTNVTSPEDKIEKYRVIKAEELSFHEPELIKEFSESSTTYLFYKVGDVTEGDYKDYEVIRGTFSTIAGPCKGPGCGKPIFTRYLKKGNKLIFLSSNSEIDDIDQWAYTPTLINEWHFVMSDQLVLEPLQIIDEIKYKNGKIEYAGQEEGVPNDKVEKLFEDPKLGVIYTTKTIYSPQEPFYSGKETAYPTTGRGGSGKESCYGTECYLTNGLFKFMPDGTFLIYEYGPEEITDTLNIDNKILSIKKYEGDYYYITRSGCSGNDADYISISAPAKVSVDDLTEVGYFTQTGNKVYFFKSIDHPYLKYFYEKYESYYPEIERYRWGDDEDLPFRTYEEFASEYSLLFFEDDFGRLIRLVNNEFVIPYACEPIIYLYPEKEMGITLKMDTNLIVSEPEYIDGWTVLAKPNGEIMDTHTKEKYPYLFWEGTLDYLPNKSDGFVIKKDNIRAELAEILPRLGLNEKECTDFMEAWIPNLESAPYYFITFHNIETINSYAPLKIDPTPQTILRVLMEYEPLNVYKNVPSFIYPIVPARDGFTLVEWGGILR